MLVKMMPLKKKRGFTLVELIVVIAIVGVLAAIIIPVVTGYVDKANRANDKTMAKHIHDRAQIVMTEDFDAFKSFRSHNSGNFVCTADGFARYNMWDGSVQAEGDYWLVIVGRINGTPNCKNNGEYRLMHCNNELQYFCACFNNDIGLVTLGKKTLERKSMNNQKLMVEQFDTDEGKLCKSKKMFKFPMKATSHEINFINTSDGNLTDNYLICHRRGEPNNIEVWAGYSFGAGGSGPRYRIYPDPCPVYTA